MGLLDFANWDLGGLIVGFLNSLFGWLIGLIEDVLGL
jgi:hypothetical protein